MLWNSSERQFRLPEVEQMNPFDRYLYLNLLVVFCVGLRVPVRVRVDIVAYCKLGFIP